MIVEHEVIEQIAGDAAGRPLTWVCDLLRSLGRDDALTLLSRMWQAGYIALAEAGGAELPRWRCAEVFRATDGLPEDVHVLVTEAGSRWVYGR